VPVLLCDLASVVTTVGVEEVYRRLVAANGGQVGLSGPQELRDDALDAFEAGRLGEFEYARQLRARLAWEAGDQALVEIVADLYASVDVGVMELLLELRAHGWFLVGLDHRAAAAQPVWGQRYADQLQVFDVVLPGAQPVGAVPAPQGAHHGTDPRFFARVLRSVPAGHGPRLFVAERPEIVAAARRAGLDGHLYRGAAGLRSACLAMSVVV
jgi:hypothetical protein